MADQHIHHLTQPFQSAISHRVVSIRIGNVDPSGGPETLKRFTFSTLQINKRWVTVGVSGLEPDAEIITGVSDETPVDAVLAAIRTALERTGGFDITSPIHVPEELQTDMALEEEQ